MKQISFQSVYQTITERGQFKLGERAMTPDGREWVFVNATTLAKGSVAVPQAVASADDVSSSTDMQGRSVYITKAAAGWTVGAYEDAIGYVDDGTGRGQTFKIKTNSATILTLYPETALATALTVAGNSDITIRTMAKVDKSAISSKIQSAVGIAQCAFTSGDYGWLLTNGDGCVLAGEALVVGTGFVTGDDTTGQVLKATTAKGTYDEQNLGFCLVANAAADLNALVRVNIR